MLSSQELLALKSLSSLTLVCPSFQLPDATAASGWHSLRRLEFLHIKGEAMERAFDAITALPHLECLACYLTALPARFSALSKLRELRLGQRLDVNSQQVSHLSSPGQKLIHHNWC